MTSRGVTSVSRRHGGRLARWVWLHDANPHRLAITVRPTSRPRPMSTSRTAPIAAPEPLGRRALATDGRGWRHRRTAPGAERGARCRSRAGRSGPSTPRRPPRSSASDPSPRCHGTDGRRRGRLGRGTPADRVRASHGFVTARRRRRAGRRPRRASCSAPATSTTWSSCCPGGPGWPTTSGARSRWSTAPPASPSSRCASAMPAATSSRSCRAPRACSSSTAPPARSPASTAPPRPSAGRSRSTSPTSRSS